MRMRGWMRWISSHRGSTAAVELASIRDRLRRIQTGWPIEPLMGVDRRELQISSSIESAIDRVISNDYPATQPGEADEPRQAVVAPDRRRRDPHVSSAQRLLNSLAAISDGSLSRRYPFPEPLRRPDSFPTHYEDLDAGVRRAIRGESLPWYRRWIRF